MSDPILQSHIKDFADRYDLGKLTDPELFSRFVSHCVLSHLTGESLSAVLDDLDVDGGQDTSIDSICIIINDHIVRNIDDLEVLLKAKTLDVDFVFLQSKSARSFEAAEIGSLFVGVRNFFSINPILPTNKHVREFIEMKARIFECSIRFRENPRVRVVFASKGTWREPQEVIGRVEMERAALLELDIFSEVSFKAYDAGLLRKLYRELVNQVEREVSFDKHTILPQIEKTEEAYLGILSAKEFLKLITNDAGDLNRSLFYDNVRDFLGENSVNQEIAASLTGPGLGDRFGLLNNGITIVAQSIKKTGVKFALYNYQIVNGCQTSNVVFKSRASLDDSVFLPIKLIVTSDIELKGNIIKATNRQTEVKSEAFESLRQIHGAIEELYAAYSRTKPVRVYYERRAKQYAEHNILPYEIVSLAGQIKAFVGTMLNEPQSTHRYYGELLSTNRHRIFLDQHNPQPYYAAGLAVFRIDALLRSGALPRWAGRFRYHLAMLARILSIDGEVPLFGKLATDASQELCEILWDEAKSRALVNSALSRLKARLADFGNAVGADRRKNFTDHLLGEFGNVSQRPRGTVKNWIDERGFGFVALDIPVLSENSKKKFEDAFVHFTQVIESRLRELRVGDRVELDPVITERGLEGRNVRVVVT